MTGPQFTAAPRRIENPVTGDRIEFLASPLHGDPGPLVFRCHLAPGAKGSPLHRHASLDETFAVEQGALAMTFDARGGGRILERGDEVACPAGAAHGFRNALNAPTVFVSTVSHGTGFERFLRTMYGLAADGRTDADGMLRDPRALALALAYADLVMPAVPRGVQRAVLGTLSWLGRAARLEQQFARYWPQATATLAREAA